MLHSGNSPPPTKYMSLVFEIFKCIHLNFTVHSCKQASKQVLVHIHMCNAVPLLWGSVRLAPIGCNQYSSCRHIVYTTCSWWLHNPGFYLALFRCISFCYCAQSSPSMMYFAACTRFETPFFFNLGFKKTSKTWLPGCFKWLVRPQTGN